MTGDRVISGREYYEKYYRNYAAQSPPRKLAFYRKLATGFVGDSTSNQIADLGCAFGDFLGSMPSRWERFGFDTNAYAVEVAKTRHPGVRFATIQDFEIPEDRRFDVITAFDVLEHVPDLGAAFEVIQTHLSQTGLLVFVVPVYDGPLGGVVGLLDKDPTHVHKRSRFFWLEFVSRWFTILECVGVFRLFVAPANYYIHAPAKGLWRFSPAIAVVARIR